jgi:hypothetical protein
MFFTLVPQGALQALLQVDSRSGGNADQHAFPFLARVLPAANASHFQLR